MVNVDGVLIKYSKPFDLLALGRDIVWRREMAEQQRVLSKKLFDQRETLCNCPICNHDESEVYVEIFLYQYFKCGNCQHIYLSTPVSDEAVTNLYDGKSDNQSTQAKIYLAPGIFEKRLEAIAYPKVDFVVEALAAINQSVTKFWMDIGCGAGEVLVAAKNRGWDVLGIESDKAEASFAKSQGVSVISEYISDRNATQYMQDVGVVSLFNVLEHIKKPTALLKLISENLGNGLVVFEVPRHPSISSLNCQMFPEMACRHIYPPDHLHIFTEDSVATMLLDCDLELKAVWYFGQDYSDLLHAAAANQSAKDTGLWQQAVRLQSKVQEIIDQAGLSDTMVGVATRRI